MRDSDFYPAGAAKDPNAPYNSTDTPEKDFDIEVNVTLTKNCTVTTNDYVEGASGVEYEYDEEGGHALPWTESDDTSNTDWEKAYKDSCFTIPEMMKELQKYVEREIDERKAIGQKVPYKLQQLLEDCKGWELVETEINEL